MARTFSPLAKTNAPSGEIYEASIGSSSSGFLLHFRMSSKDRKETFFDIFRFLSSFSESPYVNFIKPKGRGRNNSSEQKGKQDDIRKLLKKVSGLSFHSG